jgi:uncharacterized protein (TIGR02001 family)
MKYFFFAIVILLFSATATRAEIQDLTSQELQLSRQTDTRGSNQLLEDIFSVFRCQATLIDNAEISKELTEICRVDGNQKTDYIEEGVSFLSHPDEEFYLVHERELTREDFDFKDVFDSDDLLLSSCQQMTEESTICQTEAQYLSQETTEADADADNEPLIPGEFSASVSLMTDYMLRGISQTDNNPALQGSFDYNIPLDEKTGFYLGVFASTVDFNDGDQAALELDFYGGVTYQATDRLSLELGGLYYTYPGASSSLNYNFFEALLAARYDLDVAQLATLLYYSPDYFAGTDDGLYVQGTVNVPFENDFFASASIGHQSIGNNTAYGTPDYFDWSLGVGYTLGNFTLLLQYIDTNLSSQDCFSGANLCDARVVFTISR